MKKYIYKSLEEYNHFVYQCIGFLENDEDRTAEDENYKLIITKGFKGDCIREDLSLFLIPNRTNVLKVLHGEYKDKSFLITEELEFEFVGIQFLDYVFGVHKTVNIPKIAFQEVA
ncbi:hypothetical protein BK126_26260 [Paenibacillus sp. FSL H7-0326]|uniref:hypothetical protein n=1 Tax=Paenibacillus sp. FSL H7-0326 TaxID=1921144 RepID=UPI00096F061F|nr:hypothetical protein [Paenibacillus sp. FSL H7-0326]OMC63699.1 hypothetical protein BK126_26260 [Paenibacillus sp. FSL H7-0326]